LSHTARAWRRLEAPRGASSGAGAASWFATESASFEPLLRRHGIRRTATSSGDEVVVNRPDQRPKQFSAQVANAWQLVWFVQPVPAACVQVEVVSICACALRHSPQGELAVELPTPHCEVHWEKQGESLEQPQFSSW
jgi:hypothetical protein